MRRYIPYLICGAAWFACAIGGSPYPTLPADTSFISKLADEAIATNDDDRIQDPRYARLVFASSFLHGFATPDGTLPGSEKLLGNRGWLAGQKYRRDQPDSISKVMGEYRYREFEGTGTWTFAFETNQFKPDKVGSDLRTSGEECWDFETIRSAELDAQLAKVVSVEQKPSSTTIRVYVKGFLSPEYVPPYSGYPYVLHVCKREFYAVSISLAGG